MRNARNIRTKIKQAELSQKAAFVLRAIVESPEMIEALEEKDFELKGEPPRMKTNGE